MIKIHTEGVEGLQAELKGIISTEKLSHALELGAIAVESEAKLRCPVATGRLQKSIIRRKISDLTYEIKATANYADYIEYGTRYIIAGTPEDPYIYMGPVSGKFPSYRPFLRSALYDRFNQIIKLIEMELEKK